jgi:DNA-directed RNA polymerase specialized sigma24 family protein
LSGTQGGECERTGSDLVPVGKNCTGEEQGGERALGGALSSSGEPLDALAPAAYARILRICRFERLPASDAEDVAQDIWVWLIESGRSQEATSPRWLAAVTINYVRRRRRDGWRRAARENDAAGRRGSESIDPETLFSFDEMERRLPRLEARLLRLVREGATFAEASRRLSIPRGSSDYYRKMLYRQIAKRLALREGVV